MKEIRQKKSEMHNKIRKQYICELFKSVRTQMLQSSFNNGYQMAHQSTNIIERVFAKSLEQNKLLPQIRNSSLLDDLRQQAQRLVKQKNLQGMTELFVLTANILKDDLHPSESEKSIEIICLIADCLSLHKLDLQVSSQKCQVSEILGTILPSMFAYGIKSAIEKYSYVSEKHQIDIEELLFPSLLNVLFFTIERVLFCALSENSYQWSFSQCQQGVNVFSQNSAEAILIFMVQTQEEIYETNMVNKYCRLLPYIRKIIDFHSEALCLDNVSPKQLNRVLKPYSSIFLTFYELYCSVSEFYNIKDLKSIFENSTLLNILFFDLQHTEIQEIRDKCFKLMSVYIEERVQKSLLKQLEYALVEDFSENRLFVRVETCQIGCLKGCLKFWGSIVQYFVDSDNFDNVVEKYWQNIIYLCVDIIDRISGSPWMIQANEQLLVSALIVIRLLVGEGNLQLDKYQNKYYSHLINCGALLKFEVLRTQLEKYDMLDDELQGVKEEIELFLNDQFDFSAS